MTIATSLFLIGVGAILKYAVTASVSGVRLQTDGLILMIVGGIALIIGPYLYARGRSTPPPVSP